MKNCVSDILNNIISTNKLRNNGVMSGLSDLLSLSIPQFEVQTNGNAAVVAAAAAAASAAAANDAGQIDDKMATLSLNKNNSGSSANATPHGQSNSNSLLNRTSIMIALPDIHTLVRG